MTYGFLYKNLYSVLEIWCMRISHFSLCIIIHCIYLPDRMKSAYCLYIKSFFCLCPSTVHRSLIVYLIVQIVFGTINCTINRWSGLVISIQRLFGGNLFFCGTIHGFSIFFKNDFYFKTVKIIFFLPQNPVLGTVLQKNVFICGSVV